MHKYLQSFTSSQIWKRIPLIAAGIALLLYLVQSVIFTQIRLPNLDEGAYLYKGLQFARGTYQPFQDYGFWTNKMYLPFYFFGWVQQLFAPGLLAPRLFAVFLGTLSVTGIWLTIRRLSNDWLAAIGLWTLALNPAMISIYSIGNSQVVTICVLSWVMFFTLGENRRTWQILCGGFLAGILVLCRENMIFVLPSLSLYIFWQHGRKNGLLALLVMGSVLLIGHLIFWPDILYLWVRQLPFNISDKYSVSSGLKSSINNRFSPISRLHSLSLAFRVFFVPISALFVTIVFWVKKSSWKTQWHYKASVFLASTLVVLTAVHAWASIGQNYCVYCATNYFSFFAPTGLVLLAVSFSSFNKNPGKITSVLFAFSLPITGVLVGLSYFEQYGYNLMNLAVPRISNGKFLPGTVALWQMLNNKFDLSYEAARFVIPTLVGFLIGILIVLLIWISSLKKRTRNNYGFAYSAVLVMLIIGFLLTPFLSWPTQESFSKTSVTKAYQEIGLALASAAEPGTNIYLDGKITSIPLLYVEDIKILPPQINSSYSFSDNPDVERVSLKGFWNAEMGQKWKDQSEIFVIGEDNLSQWQGYFDDENLIEVPVDFDFTKMPEFSRVYIFKRE